MGQGIFLGEAYLPLQEICEDENMDRDLTELPQLQLPLTRPQDQGNLGDLKRFTLGTDPPPKNYEDSEHGPICGTGGSHISLKKNIYL